MATDQRMEIQKEPARPALFPLDEFEFEVYICADEAELPLGYKLRKPTKADLVEREQHVTNEQVQVSDTETETIYDAASGHRYLWNKIVTHVKGYDMGDGLPLNEWREANDLIKSLIPPTHKVSAVAGLYSSKVTIDRAQKSEGFKLLGAIEIRVRQEIGEYVVTHVLRRPSESEWLAYQGKALRTLTVRGAKTPRVRYETNISASCDLYDALLERVEGASLGGEPYRVEQRAGFLAATDAILKQAVIAVFSNDYESELRD